MKYKEHKKNTKGWFPFLLVGAFLIILVVMVLSVAASSSTKNTDSDKTSPNMDNSKEEDAYAPILAVLKEVDAGSSTMTLLDTANGQDIIVNYTGASNIVDKYDKVIAASQLTVGEMVDAYYDRNTAVLSKLQISNRAWEYKGVTKWDLDESQGSFTIVDSKYQFPSELVVEKAGKLLTIKDLDPKDELVVKGVDRKVWSIQVIKGHGTIRFEDYADFVGGTVYIGNKEILPIEEDMSITVLEGSYKITMEKGSLKGSKELEVKPFLEAVLDMGEFKLPPVEKGKVAFHITPEGADLYINDELTDYNKAVELAYGKYTVKTVLGGYTDYNGSLEVAGPTKTVTIDLSEARNGEDTDNNGSSNNNSNSNNGNSNNSNSNNSNGNNNSSGNNSNGNNSNGNNGNNNSNSNNSSNNNNNSNNNTDANSSKNDSNTKDTKDTNYNGVKADQNIYVQDPEGASAYFDGQFKGTVPVSFPKVTGTHYVTLILSGHQTKTYTVEITNDGEDVKLSFTDLDKK
jgi:hypothetical protein